MIRAIKGIAAATALALVLAGGTAAAQRSGGILRVYSAESPPASVFTSRRHPGARAR